MYMCRCCISATKHLWVPQFIRTMLSKRSATGLISIKSYLLYLYYIILYLPSYIGLCLKEMFQANFLWSKITITGLERNSPNYAI